MPHGGDWRFPHIPQHGLASLEEVPSLLVARGVLTGLYMTARVQILSFIVALGMLVGCAAPVDTQFESKGWDDGDEDDISGLWKWFNTLGYCLVYIDSKRTDESSQELYDYRYECMPHVRTPEHANGESGYWTQSAGTLTRQGNSSTFNSSDGTTTATYADRYIGDDKLTLNGITAPWAERESAPFIRMSGELLAAQIQYERLVGSSHEGKTYLFEPQANESGGLGSCNVTIQRGGHSAYTIDVSSSDCPEMKARDAYMSSDHQWRDSATFFSRVYKDSTAEPTRAEILSQVKFEQKDTFDASWTHQIELRFIKDHSLLFRRSVAP